MRERETERERLEIEGVIPWPSVALPLSLSLPLTPFTSFSLRLPLILSLTFSIIPLLSLSIPLATSPFTYYLQLISSLVFFPAFTSPALFLFVSDASRCVCFMSLCPLSIPDAPLKCPLNLCCLSFLTLPSLFSSISL